MSSLDTRGHVHPGILKSAQYVLESVISKLQDAVLQAPGLPILVTGALLPAIQSENIQIQALSI